MDRDADPACGLSLRSYAARRQRSRSANARGGRGAWRRIADRQRKCSLVGQMPCGRIQRGALGQRIPGPQGKEPGPVVASPETQIQGLRIEGQGRCGGETGAQIPEIAAWRVGTAVVVAGNDPGAELPCSPAHPSRGGGATVLARAAGQACERAGASTDFIDGQRDAPGLGLVLEHCRPLPAGAGVARLLAGAVGSRGTGARVDGITPQAVGRADGEAAKAGAPRKRVVRARIGQVAVQRCRTVGIRAEGVRIELGPVQHGVLAPQCEAAPVAGQADKGLAPQARPPWFSTPASSARPCSIVNRARRPPPRSSEPRRPMRDGTLPVRPGMRFSEAPPGPHRSGARRMHRAGHRA